MPLYWWKKNRKRFSFKNSSPWPTCLRKDHALFWKDEFGLIISPLFQLAQIHYLSSRRWPRFLLACDLAVIILQLNNGAILFHPHKKRTFVIPNVKSMQGWVKLGWAFKVAVNSFLPLFSPSICVFRERRGSTFCCRKLLYLFVHGCMHANICMCAKTTKEVV